MWNANAVTAVVACFNIQGSAYERSLRRFNTHDASPPALAASVRPSDAPVLAGTAELFAAYLNSTKVRGRAVPAGEAGGGLVLAWGAGWVWRHIRLPAPTPRTPANSTCPQSVFNPPHPPRPPPCQELRLLGAGDGLEVRLPGGGGSDVVTLSPLVEAGGVLFAPIGLTNMLNAGGAVLRSVYKRSAGRCRSSLAVPTWFLG